MRDDATHRAIEGTVPRDVAETVEAYETDQGTVLYDAGNPLAWIESNVAVPIREVT